ncbi:MAG: sodium:solute symporter family protein [Bacteroidota bacterium]
MDLQIWTFLIVALTFALYIGIAIWSRAGSTKDFYVAGGGVSPLANGMATAADWMSAASFISMAGLISFMGYDGGVYLMGWTGGYVLLALLLAPYLRKFGQFTVPDFIGSRYRGRETKSGVNVARLVALFCAIFVSFTYIVGQMKGVGVAFSRFLDVPFDVGVIIGIAIVFFYAVLGGMKGITYTQVAQYCVLIFAYLVPAIFLSLQITGTAIPQAGFIGGEFKGEGISLLDKLNQLNTDLGFSEYTSGTKSTVDVFFITAALMLGTAGLPHVIVRFFTVPKVSDARKSAGYALVFIALLYTTAPAIAAFARTNMIDTVMGPDGRGVEYATAPQWIKNWQDADLIKYEDKNGDGRIQYYNDQSESGKALAAANGWQGNEFVPDRDIMVLALPEIAKLPNWVIALVVAGGLAAALSTAAGLLLVISTSISHDLLKKTFMPNISDKQELSYARIAAGVAVVGAGIAGMNPPGFVAQVVAFAFGLAASSFFPAILLGIFSKRTNSSGAIAGMIVGIVFTATYIIYFKIANPELNTPDNWFFGISPEGIGTLGMLINLAVTLTVSRLTPAPSAEIQQIVEDIRIPRGAGQAQVH